MSKWIIDSAHSEVGFQVKHLKINTVKGRFKTFSGEAESSDDNFKSAKISFAADLSSIDTGNETRDNHLKTADFFNAEKHPKLIFAGKYEAGKLTGDLTMAGITKPVSLNAILNGINKDPYGNTKAGFSITG